MRWSRAVTMIEAHAEGEVGRVVTGGLPNIPGATLPDQMRYLNEVDDSLRRLGTDYIDLLYLPDFATVNTRIVEHDRTSRPSSDVVGFR